MLISKIEFLKDSEIARTIGQVQFAVFEKLASASLYQTARESMLLLAIVYMKNASLKAAHAESSARYL